MKDMFGRELTKWDIILLPYDHGTSFALISGFNKNTFNYRKLDIEGNLTGDPMETYPDEAILLSTPEILKIKVDTMKLAGEEI